MIAHRQIVCWFRRTIQAQIFCQFSHIVVCNFIFYGSQTGRIIIINRETDIQYSLAAKPDWPSQVIIVIIHGPCRRFSRRSERRRHENNLRKVFNNVFNNEYDCNAFLSHLNSLRPSLRFTHEKESNHSLPFLDVLVERRDSEFSTSVYRKPTFTGQYSTSVYRKPTFTGQYLRWNSFSPTNGKSI